MNTVRKCWIVLFCFSMSGCSPVGLVVCIYSELDNEAMIILSGFSGDEKYQWPMPNNIASVYEFRNRRFFKIKSASGTRCYNVTPVGRKWFDHGFSGKITAYALLGEDNKIYLFDKAAHGDHKFYETKIPKQPEGYPLEPLAAWDCAING